MSKIVIIGAGSGFGGRLSIDILVREPLRDATIALCDIHPGRLEKVKAYVELAIKKHNLPAKVEASVNRRDLLPGADFVVTSVAVGGGAYYGYPYNAEIEIPRKYGMDIYVGDTVSTAAVFRFLRTAPIHLQILRDMEELCPNALQLNHTNPMAMLTWMHHAASSIRNVGLCHGIQGTSRKIAEWINVPEEEITYQWAGINHMAWLLECRRGEEDLYPRLRALIDGPNKVEGEAVRFQILKHFGRFCTESNRHASEYVPYFRKRPDMLEQFDCVPRNLITALDPSKRVWTDESGGDTMQKSLEELQASREFSSGIMQAVVTDKPYKFYGNVQNTGLIPNLPEGCCVEVPCMTDRAGIHPCYVGNLPPQLAALCRSNVAVQQLAVEAFIERDREKAFHACALDPLTAAILTLDQIRSMFEELWDVEKDLLAYFDKSHSGVMPETCAD